mgnify:CR=1 FL=1
MRDHRKKALAIQVLVEKALKSAHKLRKRRLFPEFTWNIGSGKSPLSRKRNE